MKRALNKVIVVLMAAVYGVTFVACDVFTSMNRIKDMVLNEEQILNKIKDAAPQLLGNEQHAMYNFYKQRLEEIHRRNWTKELERLNHPNGAYSIIKEYAADYQALRQAVLDSKLNQASAVLAEIADDNDVKGARESLLRLQEVFRMSTNEMVKGMYLNYKGPILNSTDAFLVGKAAFEIGKQTLCTEWLQAALELMRQEQQDDDNYNDDFSKFGRIDTKTDAFGNDGAAMKALLGRALIRVGQTEQARELYNSLKPEDFSIGDAKTLGEELKDFRKVVPESLSRDLDSFYKLCGQQSKTLVKVSDPRLRCRYVTVLLPYYRFNEEIVSNEPYVSLFYDVISNQQAEDVKQNAIVKLYRGKVMGQDGLVTSSIRTSHIAFLEDGESPTAKFIAKRIKYLTNLDTETHEDGFHAFKKSSAEPLQVVNYGLGGHYSVHLDPYEHNTVGAEKIMSNYGNRMATFLIYLTDVERGGSTAFPRADIVVSPVKRNAVFWYSFTPDGAVDRLTLHAGCPVLVGEKWIINKWILSYGNTFTRRCGLRRNATQLDIDPFMSRGFRPRRKKQKRRTN